MSRTRAYPKNLTTKSLEQLYSGQKLNLQLRLALFLRKMRKVFYNLREASVLRAKDSQIRQMIVYFKMQSSRRKFKVQCIRKLKILLQVALEETPARLIPRVARMLHLIHQERIKEWQTCQAWDPNRAKSHLQYIRWTDLDRLPQTTQEFQTRATRCIHRCLHLLISPSQYFKLNRNLKLSKMIILLRATLINRLGFLLTKILLLDK